MASVNRPLFFIPFCRPKVNDKFLFFNLERRDQTSSSTVRSFQGLTP